MDSFEAALDRLIEAWRDTTTPGDLVAAIREAIAELEKTP